MEIAATTRLVTLMILNVNLHTPTRSIKTDIALSEIQDDRHAAIHVVLDGRHPNIVMTCAAAAVAEAQDTLVLESEAVVVATRLIEKMGRDARIHLKMKVLLRFM